MVPGGEQCTHCDLLSMKMEFILFLERRNGPALNGGRLLFSNKRLGELDTLSSGQSRPAKHVGSTKDSKTLLKKIKKCLLDLELCLTR